MDSVGENVAEMIRGQFTKAEMLATGLYTEVELDQAFGYGLKITQGRALNAGEELAVIAGLREFTVETVLEAPAGTTGTVIIGIYDANHSLAGTAMCPFVIGAERRSVLTLPVQLEQANGSYIKIMVWKDTKNLVPMTPARVLFS